MRQAGIMKRLSSIGPSLLLVSIALGLVGSFYIETYLHTRNSYGQTVNTIRDDLFNYANLAGEHTVNVLDSADHLLLILRYAYAHGKNVRELLRFMTEHMMPNLDLNQIGIIDEHGIYTESSLPGHERIDLSDREHFKFHLHNAQDVPHISKPLVGRASGKLSIQLSRRIDKPDGSFGGVVVASINPDYFSKLYKQVRLGRSGTITIVGLDGVIRFRQDRERFSAGQDLSSSGLLQEVATRDSGYARNVSLVDGVERFFTYKKLHSYPLIVLVAMGTDEALAGYRANSRFHMTFATLCAVLTILLTIVILWLFRKKRRMLEQVEASRKLAEAANQSKSEFLAKVTHEVRTPLHAVKGMTDSLLQTPLTADQRDCLDTVLTSSDHLLGLVDDLLDIAKIEAGQLRLAQVPFDLRALFETVRRILNPLAQAKGLAFELDGLEGQAPLVLVGDPRRLRQVILNLTGNAIKFTTEGAVRLVVGCQPLGNGDRLRLDLRVEDTGPGIPESVRESIFQPFSQADSSIAGQYGGTGLGLTISRQLVELMGGTLLVESTVGQGSTFRVRLEMPRSDSPVGGDRPERNLTLPPLAIMVVDDNPTNRKVAFKLLERLGQTPEYAGSGRDALTALAGKAYDVVLLDIEMAGMDGYEVARRIRRGEAGAANRDVPVIALTAHALPAVRDDCLAAGMQGFLSKPVETARLYAELSSLGRRPRSRRTCLVPRPPEALAAELDVPGALERLEGDRALYRGVFEDFAAQYRPDSPLWGEEAPREAEAMRRFAHSLKSAARTLGAEGLAATAARIEELVRAGQPEAALAMFPELRRRLEGTIAAIAPIVAGFAPAEETRPA